MTVKELIDKLNEVEDKTVKMYYADLSKGVEIIKCYPAKFWHTPSFSELAVIISPDLYEAQVKDERIRNEHK